MSHQFCICGSRRVFIDIGGVTRYRCPNCNDQIPVTGAGTQLYEITTGQTGDIFDTLLTTSAEDPCNRKIVEACPRCLRPTMTLLLIGPDEKPFKSCKCGNILGIEQAETLVAAKDVSKK